MSIDYYLLATVKSDQTDFPFLDSTVNTDVNFLMFCKDMGSGTYPIALKLWLGKIYNELGGKDDFNFITVQITKEILDRLISDVESDKIFTDSGINPDENSIYHINRIIDISYSVIDSGGIVYLEEG